MIFIDESGKRWKRIKRSTAALSLLGALPVVAVVGASISYHPEWGALPLVQQAAGVIASVTSSQPSEAAATSTPAPSPAPTARRTTTSAQRVLGTIAPTTPKPTTPATRPGATPTATATPSATVTPTPTPTQGNPTRNDFGQSHKPVK